MMLRKRTLVGGVDAGWGLLPPAPTYIVLTLLVAALVVNAAMVLVVLPRVAGALEYGLSLGDLYDLIGKNLEQGHGRRVESDMGETMLREPGIADRRSV
jgi:hypothetical protein